MKQFFLFVALLCGVSPAFGQSNKTWRDIIEKCNPTQEIGKQTLFFGVSNLIGPGSMWRRANDKSIRLVYELSDGFPSATEQADIIKGGNITSCSATQSSKWNIKFGLPFSTGATPLTIDIGLTLGKAHDVNVSIAGYAVDTLVEGNWKDHLNTLGKASPTNGYYKEAYQPAGTLLLAENVVKVTGFRAVFNYSTDLSLDASAKFKGKSFILGNSVQGAGNMLGNSSDATATNGAAANKKTTPNKGAAASKETTPDKGTTASSGSSGGSTTATASRNATGACASNKNPEEKTATKNPQPVAAADAAKKTLAAKDTASAKKDTTAGNSGDSLATLHVDFNGARQIIVCADGPFYVLAAYSGVKNGSPVGIAPRGKPSILLIPTGVPDEVTALDKDSTPNP